MQKQKQLDQALRAGVSTGRVSVDKLMASTVHTLIKYNIEFTPASTSEDAVQDDRIKFILLKPENEPAKKRCVVKNVSKFGVQKSPHRQHNKMKQSTKNRKFIRKGRCEKLQ